MKSKLLIGIFPIVILASNMLMNYTSEYFYAYASIVFLTLSLMIGTAIFLGMDANISLYLAEIIIRHRPSILRNVFNDKVTFIAGASDGIGAETARQLCAKTNTTVVLMARTLKKLEKVQRECETIATKHSSGASVIIVVGDVTKGEQYLCDVMNNTLKIIKRKQIDILFISAGRAYERQIELTDMELIRSTFELNVMGAVSTVKAFMSIDTTPSIQNKHIILISSLVGKMPTALSAGYSASKAAVNLFFDTLRAEYAASDKHNIRVTTVCPGPVATNIFEASAKAMGEALDENFYENDLQNMMTPERAVSLMLAGCVSSPFWMFFELWIAPQPLLLFTYVNQFSPEIIKHFASARMKQKRNW